MFKALESVDELMDFIAKWNIPVGSTVSLNISQYQSLISILIKDGIIVPGLNIAVKGIEFDSDGSISLESVVDWPKQVDLNGYVFKLASWKERGRYKDNKEVVAMADTMSYDFCLTKDSIDKVIQGDSKANDLINKLQFCMMMQNFNVATIEESAFIHYQLWRNEHPTANLNVIESIMRERRIEREEEYNAEMNNRRSTI